MIRAIRGIFGDRPAGFRADGATFFVFPVWRAMAIPGYQGRQLIGSRERLARGAPGGLDCLPATYYG